MNWDGKTGLIVFEDEEDDVTVGYAHVQEIEVEKGTPPAGETSSGRSATTAPLGPHTSTSGHGLGSPTSSGPRPGQSRSRSKWISMPPSGLGSKRRNSRLDNRTPGHWPHS